MPATTLRKTLAALLFALAVPYVPAEEADAQLEIIRLRLFNRRVTSRPIGRGALVCTFTNRRSRVCRGTYFLPRLIGTARAMGLALLTEPLSAEKAESWGLIWKVLDDERLMPEATALARKLAAGPTKSFGLIKKAFLASGQNTLDAQLELERDLQREAGFSEDYRKAVAEFMEKQK